MTNDSDLFRTREELEEKERAWPIGGNRFDSPVGEWLPLYEGKMVQAFDHRPLRASWSTLITSTDPRSPYRLPLLSTKIQIGCQIHISGYCRMRRPSRQPHICSYSRT